MSLTVKRETQVRKKEKRSNVPLIRIGVSDKPRPHICQFEPIRKLLLVRDNVTKRDRWFSQDSVTFTNLLAMFG